MGQQSAVETKALVNLVPDPRICCLIAGQTLFDRAASYSFTLRSSTMTTRMFGCAKDVQGANSRATVSSSFFIVVLV
jgi:hypothetical protein